MPFHLIQIKFLPEETFPFSDDIICKNNIFFKCEKAFLKSEAALKPIIVVEELVLPGSVRSLGIKMLMAYVAEFENMDLRNESVSE